MAQNPYINKTLTSIAIACDVRAGELLRRQPPTELATDTAFLLLAAARRLSPGAATPGGPQVAHAQGGAGFTQSCLAWADQRQRETRFQVCQRAAEMVLGDGAALWMTATNPSLEGAPCEIGAISDEGMARVLECLEDLRGSRNR